MRALLILLLLAQNVRAEVLVRGLRVSPVEYRAALRADPDLLAPSASAVAHLPSARSRETLLRTFAEAQKAFVASAGPEVEAAFEKVISLQLTDDWAAIDRQIFLHAFLRLAQVQSQAEKQNEILKRALLVGDDLRADATLFPPPLLKALAKLRKEIARVNVPAEIFEDGWSLLLINGVPCARNACTPWPRTPQKLRVTFLSDMWQPVTMTLEAEELRQALPEKVAWATGDCVQSQLAPAAAAFKNPRVFWGVHCFERTSGEKVIADKSSAPKTELNLQPQWTPPEGELRVEKASSEKAFYKSPWLWAGVGVVIATAFLLSQKKSSEKEPTTSYGY